jgi:hypothetical protein
MTTVRTSSELGKAIKRKESTIIVEGDIIHKVIRIKLTGPIAWGVACIALGSAIYFYLSTPAATISSTPLGGTGGAISFSVGTGAAGAAVTILGINVTIVAIGIGVAAGGVGALTTLRDKYKVTDKSKGRLVLKRK